ncbi:hypothetical protein GGS24DRAFT_149177 [Hypoxylon argillaceum]|nr:hypothetical protein GGS24DRAFT_149177 [Hypoxylon argillaceum]
MEPLPSMIEYLLGPAIVHIPLNPAVHESRGSRSSWEISNQNPKNRIDSVKESEADWRVFRADFVRGKMSAVPAFAIGRPPLRVDVVFGPKVDLEADTWTRPLMSKLSTMVQTSGLSRSFLAEHVAAALGHWTCRTPGFQEQYLGLPFGSRIVVINLTQDIRLMEIGFDPDHRPELEWSSIHDLRSMWHFPLEIWPPNINIEELELISEIHDSITLVSLRGSPSTQYIFKASTSSASYIYHELKQLLLLDKHPNIVNGPLYLVTSRVKFGNKEGVCGFLLEHYPLGNLAQALRPGSDIQQSIDLQMKFRWGMQIGNVLLQVCSSPVGYFSDLKLENIVLKENHGRYDAVLIDFEQRGAWFSWSPPEINKITHLAYLASRTTARHIPVEVREKYKRFLDTYLVDWNRFLRRRRQKYENPDAGYNISWRALDKEEREKAMVFMFGRLLWCIFEVQASANAAEFLGAEVFREWDPRYRFPRFEHTPLEIQQLINQCTHDAPEWSGKIRCIERYGDVVYSLGRSPAQGSTPASKAETVKCLKRWWSDELEDAEKYVFERSRDPDQCEAIRRAKQRPSIAEVVRQLRQFGERYDFRV